MSKIFISYSHKERGPEWKGRLLAALDVFSRHELLDVWDDGNLVTSEEFEPKIRAAMGNARLAVVLLTKQALESEFITKKELPFLRERHERDGLVVWPVVCERCEWRTLQPWLAALHLGPGGTKPLSEMSDAEASRVLRQSATEIAELLSRAALNSIPPAPGPQLSARVYLDKFPITEGPSLRGEKLIGREQELALLDLAFSQADTAIASLVAWGGVGKSMLVREWLRRLQTGSLHRDDAPRPWSGARCVYAWSFYSQGTKEDRQASEDTFLAHALTWFGVQCEPTLSPWDKGRLLADAVARERTLLILDGIEPLQYPPGPMGGQLRAPGVQILLKSLARRAGSTSAALNSQPSTLHNSLCLVTTREPLTDLADFQRHEGSPWGSVLRVDLGNLTDEAGAALLYHAGANRAGAAEIKPDEKELVAASREVDGHALTLNLLARFLARAHGGDIRRRDLVKFEEADRKEQGGTTFKMLAAFENWFARSGVFGARQLAVLRILGLFDRPADPGCIAALRSPPVITGLSEPLFTTRLDASIDQATVQPLLEEDWNTATSFLAGFALVTLQSDGDEGKYSLDCHPLIREHFENHLRFHASETWLTAHRRLYEHLCTAAPQRTKYDYQDELRERRGYRLTKILPSLEDLQPLYQAVIHGCHAGIYEEVGLQLLRTRIHRGDDLYPLRKLGAFAAELCAITAFFERPWTQPSSKISFDGQGWLLNQAACCLESLGRVAESLEPMRVGLKIRVEQEAWKSAASIAENLSRLELLLGEVTNATEDARLSISYADRSGEMGVRITSRTTHALILYQAGRRTEAETCYLEAQRVEKQWLSDPPCPASISHFDYFELRLADPEDAAWRACLAANRGSAQSSSGGRATPNETDRAQIQTADMTNLESCRFVSKRAAETLKWHMAFGEASVSDIALDHLSMGRAALYETILAKSEMQSSGSETEQAVVNLRFAGTASNIPRGLITRAWLSFLQDDTGGARADLDEAWDIAERGSMRLHLADIHLHRARLFFREKPYPWKSPQADLADAEKLINECGYHRRDGELADAKKAILGL